MLTILMMLFASLFAAAATSLLGAYPTPDEDSDNDAANEPYHGQGDGDFFSGLDDFLNDWRGGEAVGGVRHFGDEDQPVRGTGRNDVLIADTNSVVIGGPGDDLIVLGNLGYHPDSDESSAEVTGGKGHDIFLVEPTSVESAHGAQGMTITDFDTEKDVLMVSSDPFFSDDADSDTAQPFFAGDFTVDTHLSDDNADTIVEFLNDGELYTTVTLRGVTDYDVTKTLFTATVLTSPEAAGEVFQFGHVMTMGQMDDGTGQDVPVADATFNDFGAGDDQVRVDGTDAVTVLTGEGDDTVSGAAGDTDAPGYVHLRTGDGDDTVAVGNAWGEVFTGDGDDTVMLDPNVVNEKSHDVDASLHSGRWDAEDEYARGDYAQYVSTGDGNDTIIVGLGAKVDPGAGDDDITFVVTETGLQATGEVYLRDASDALDIEISPDVEGTIWVMPKAEARMQTGSEANYDPDVLYEDQFLDVYLTTDGEPDPNSDTPILRVQLGNIQYFWPQDAVDPIVRAENVNDSPILTANRVIEGYGTR